MPVYEIARVQEGRQPEVELKGGGCHTPMSLSALFRIAVVEQNVWSPSILVCELGEIRIGRHLF